jgi:hypothetical protein
MHCHAHPLLVVIDGPVAAKGRAQVDCDPRGPGAHVRVVAVVQEELLVARGRRGHGGVVVVALLRGVVGAARFVRPLRKVDDDEGGTDDDDGKGDVAPKPRRPPPPLLLLPTSRQGPTAEEKGRRERAWWCRASLYRTAATATNGTYVRVRNFARTRYSLVPAAPGSSRRTVTARIS